MRRALTIAALMVLSWIGGYRWGYAADETRHMMARVERALVDAGFEAARGYAKLDAPSVEYVEITPGGVWGTYRLGYITIKTGQPSGCYVHTLGHEIAHDAAVRMGLLDAVPTHEVMRELERISAVAESAIQDDDFAPNCVMRRVSL